MSEPNADYRDCLELAAAIADSVNAYDSDDALEPIIPHLQPVIGELQRLREELKLWKPMTDAEAEEAYERAESAEISDDLIHRICAQAVDPTYVPTQPEHVLMAEKIRRLEGRITAIREAIEKIVETEGDDAGVIYLSNDGPTIWDDANKCYVYEHAYFSPLGDAMVALWEMTQQPIRGTTQPDGQPYPV